VSAANAVAAVLASVVIAILGRPTPDHQASWNLVRALVMVIVIGVCVNLVLQIGMLSRLARNSARHNKPFSTSTAYVQLGGAVVGLLMGLTLAFWALGDQPNACTNQSLGFTDSLYFAMTVITSTGFGDIAPTTDFCRNLVTIEMGAAFLALTVGLSQLISFTGSSTKEPSER
jgi:hypothetical protein